MNVFNKSFSDINFADIQQLIATGTGENQTLEFKKIAWGNNEKGFDEGVREMLRDVSSMANAYGGYIVLGMDEETETGVAREIFSIENFEEERTRIFSSCLANIQPRLAGFNIKHVADGGKNIILIYVPSSLRAPHLVTFKGLNQFWIRHDRQKSPMSVEEIRDAFLRSVTSTDDSNKFLDRRKSELAIKNGGPCLVMGALPLDPRGDLVDVKNMALREQLQHPPNSRYGGWNFDFTYITTKPSIHGLLIGGEPDWRRVELYRNGYLEGIVQLDKRKDIREVQIAADKNVRAFNTYSIIEYQYSFFQQLKQMMDSVNYEGQLLIFVSLHNISDVHLKKYGDGSYWHETGVLSEKNLELGPFAFDYFDPDKITQTFCDRLWQSYGFENAPLFKNGKVELPV